MLENATTMTVQNTDRQWKYISGEQKWQESKLKIKTMIRKSVTATDENVEMLDCADAEKTGQRILLPKSTNMIRQIGQIY